MSKKAHKIRLFFEEHDHLEKVRELLDYLSDLDPFYIHRIWEIIRSWRKNPTKSLLNLCFTLCFMFLI